VIVFLTGGCDGSRYWAGAGLSAGAGAFGVTPATVSVLNTAETDMTNRVATDKLFDPLSPFVKAHFGVVGVAHGITAHGPARTAHFTAGGRSGLLSLASAMGGDASIKMAAVGAELPAGPTAAVNGVSIQQILDMADTLKALGAGAPDPTLPKRDIAAAAIAGTEAMSQATVTGNKDSLVTVGNGYKVAQSALKKTTAGFNPQELMTAYALTGTVVNTMNAKFAAAELMVRTGTNVVSIVDAGGWDSHGDTTGARVRGAFGSRIFPALKIFLDRMVKEDAELNIHVAIMGDFNRSAPGADHAATSSVAVIGPKIKTGSTGNVDTRIALPQGTPTMDGLWGFLAHISGGDAVAKAVVPGGMPMAHARLVATT